MDIHTIIKTWAKWAASNKEKDSIELKQVMELSTKEDLEGVLAYLAGYLASDDLTRPVLAKLAGQATKKTLICTKEGSSECPCELKLVCGLT